MSDYEQVPDFQPSFKVNGELRQYQKDGVSWMTFLDRSGLHGILADDMGLGKTLQATLVLAGLVPSPSASWNLQLTVSSSDK